ncbi:carbohydrate kinase family protein [Pseudoduganella umbonata]|uniref:Adenosine kinase n=1 Tax=Pseudoduganella umbonata TaxID=864828 RepID=A0A4V1EDP7_9BURK|nr:carbohydrate kinase family protein [Pseudoduganella umbonata]MBB3220697.1 adenosine kinase [Pseudoduganella umbonata]QCP11821.1 carbohydrate kinase family protein [Pseudoduganella umbonata]
MNQTSLICGSLAIDIIMQYEGRFGDTLLADQLHKVNVSFLVPTMRTEFGGCSGNIAYNLKLLGGDPRIVGVMGQDCAAYLERLQTLGISTQNILIKKDAYNAQCFVTADSDNNQINAFHPGAMSFAHENDIEAAGPARIAIISPDGHLGMLKHAEDLARLGIPFVFDPGQQLPMFTPEQLVKFIDQATYVTCNDYEIELLMDRTGLALEDIAARVEALIVTRGEKGSEIYTAGQRIDIPAVEAAVLDPTGCGDAYRAGLLYGLSHDLGWETTGRLASLLGAIKIAHKGAQNHLFTREEIGDRFEQAFGYRF